MVRKGLGSLLRFAKCVEQVWIRSMTLANTSRGLGRTERACHGMMR